MYKSRKSTRSTQKIARKKKKKKKSPKKQDNTTPAKVNTAGEEKKKDGGRGEGSEMQHQGIHYTPRGKRYNSNISI
jgi:outer membrane biosynthesis protein TonB